MTLDEVRQQAANYMYVFATEDYLKYLPKKYAAIIRAKKYNQKKVLALSAEKYYGDPSTEGQAYKNYVEAVRSGFLENYGMLPGEALVRLAKGETVAGKNYEAGVFGIGAAKSATFTGVAIDDKEVKVDPETGQIVIDGRLYPTTQTIYDTKKGDDLGRYQQVYIDNNNYTFVSQYNRSDRKWYACTWSSGMTGKTYKASNGKETSASKMSSVWESLALAFDGWDDWLKSVIEQLLGVNTQAANGEPLSAKNTLPNQTADGFVTKDGGLMEAGGIMLLLAAGGALLTGGLMKGKKSK